LAGPLPRGERYGILIGGAGGPELGGPRGAPSRGGGGQGPGLLHEGSIEQAPSASMAVEEPPLDGGKIW
jgi:hypothetical protein